MEGENNGNRPAVIGNNKGSGPGVEGTSAGRGPGVKGRAKNDPGVRGDGIIGVWGSFSTNGQAGVYAENLLFGPGVVGDGHGENFAGVLGRNGIGHGVRGEGQNGVVGKSATTTGYGGIFEGGKAQLLLRPGASAGKPTGAHAKGEL